MPRDRALKRKLDYLCAKRNKRRLVDSGCIWLADVPVGMFVKCHGFNHQGVFRTKKTNNKGPNHCGTYEKSHNYKHSDLKKILRMFDAVSHYERNGYDSDPSYDVVYGYWDEEE